MEKQVEYLKLLQERNRMKKAMSAQSQEDKNRDELERGFSTHFRGANFKPKNRVAAPLQAKVRGPVAAPIDPTLLFPMKKEGKQPWGQELNDIAKKQDCVFDEIVDINHPQRCISAANFVPDDFISNSDDSDTKVHQNLVSEPKEVVDSTDVEQMLVAKVRELDSGQKKMLMDLFNRKGGTYTPVKGTHKHTPIPEHDMVENEVAYNDPAQTTNLIEKPILELTRNQGSCTGFQLPQKLHFKIRVHNTWNHSNVCTLRAIRIRFVATESEMDTVDVTHMFEVELFRGLEQLGSTTDAVRSCSSLFGGGRNTVVTPLLQSATQNQWQCTLAESKPLDIHLKCVFDDEIITECCQTNRCGNRLQLIIWNGAVMEEGEHQGHVNAAPAKDVDIYFGNSCVWTGELPSQESRVTPSSPILKKSPQTIIIGDQLKLSDAVSSEECPPSLIVFPCSGLKSKPPEYRPQASPYRECRGSDTKESGHGQNKAYEEMGIFLEQKDSTPLWLQSIHGPLLNTPTQDNDVFRKNADNLVKNGSVNMPKRSGRVRNCAAMATMVLDSKDEDTRERAVTPQRSTSGRVRNSAAMAAMVLDSKDEDTRERVATPQRSTSGRVRNSAAMAAMVLDSKDEDTRERVATPQRSTWLVKKRSVATPPQLSTDSSNWKEASAEKLSKRISRHRYDVVDDSDPIIEQNFKECTENTNSSVAIQAQAPGDELSSSLMSNGRLVRQHRQLRNESTHASGLEEKLTTDSHIRRSLDAVELSEKFNLGRLASSNSSPQKCAKIEANDLFPVQEDHRNLQKGHSSILPSSEMSHEGEMTSRVHRIEAAHGKLQTTLANLADMMSKLPNVSGIQRSGNSTESKKTMTGKHLRIDVLSTWGDPYYVGFNGLELFDQTGHQISMANFSVVAYPTDINVLSDYSGDPRRACNLIDGVNFTKSDLHVWLAPQMTTVRARDQKLFNTLASKLFRIIGDDSYKSVVASVVISAPQDISLAALRIFNYNKSRAHNQRGIKSCRIWWDSSIIYDGDLNKASGSLQTPETESQVVMVSACTATQKVVLDSVKLLNKTVMQEEETDVLEESMVGVDGTFHASSLSQLKNEISACRPSTCELSSPPQKCEEAHSPIEVKVTGPILNSSQTGRDLLFAPDTNVDDHVAFMSQLESLQLKDNQRSLQKDGSSMHQPEPAAQWLSAIVGQRLKMDILTTWGDKSYVGLTGIEVLILDNGLVKVAHIEPNNINAVPRDLSSVGFFDDPRKLSNLLLQNNDCSDENIMWLVPFTKGSDHYVEVDLGSKRHVVGVRVWNYNKSHESVLRGCKEVVFTLDGERVCDHQVILRRGPGCDGVQFGHTIYFSLIDEASTALTLPDLASAKNATSHMTARYLSPIVKQDYETQQFPTGLAWQITIYENWNDLYYVGLDKIEFYDGHGNFIDMQSYGAQISAVPFNVDDLSVHCSRLSSSSDPRTPEKLFQPPCHNNAHCWLAPLSSCMTVEERAACAQKLLPGERNLGEHAVHEYSFPSKNIILVHFQFPVSISAIRIYNYSKDPSRGVKEYGLHLDGDLLYMGSLLRADREKRFDDFDLVNRSRGQVVLFSNSNRLISSLKDTISYTGSSEQDVLCINEKQVMVRSRNMYNQEPPNSAWEGVTVDLSKRPLTSVSK